MRGQLLGSLISAVFGLVYVVVNSGPLPGTVTVVLRVVGVAAFVAVVVAPVVRVRAGSRPPVTNSGPDPERLGRAYWAVVVVEAAALFGGLAVINGVLDHPEAGVAWVSTVVGVHFFALARIFALRFFFVLAVAVTGCGIAGLALAVAGASEPPIAAIGGVLPGLMLLGCGWWGAVSGPTGHSLRIAEARGQSGA